MIPTNYYIDSEQRNKRIKKIKEKRRPFIITKFLPKTEKIKNKFRFWLYRKRKIILEKKGSFCDLCKTKQSLEIHHKKYTNNLKDLQVLCRNCHVKVEQEKRYNAKENNKTYTRIL